MKQKFITVNIQDGPTLAAMPQTMVCLPHLLITGFVITGMTPKQLEIAISKYVFGRYNESSPHASNGYTTPVEIRNT